MLPTTEIIEQDLLKVRGLVESMAVQRRSQRANGSLVTHLTPTSEILEETAERLITQASENLCLIIGERSGMSAAVISAFRRAAPSLGADIAVRSLVTPTARTPVVVAALGLGKAEVRLTPMSDLTALIVDTDSTLVSNAPGDPSLIHSASVATNLRTLFDTIWPTATVLDQHLRAHEQTRAEELPQVLGCLRDGLTDEVAAKKLAMSVRTYRRYVADIMALLGTSSRFQAGVRAIETGLLSRGSTRVASRPVPVGSVSRVSPECST